MSGVTCQVLCVIFLLLSDKVLDLVGGGYFINEAYPVYFLYIFFFVERGVTFVFAYLQVFRG